MKTTGVVLLLIGISGTFGYLISLYEVRRPDRQGARRHLDRRRG